jgi:hypothetical protein
MKALKRLPILVLALFLLGIGPFCWWQNNGLVVTKMEYKNDRIPVGFREYRIVQVSDLHNKEFGKGNARLLDKLRECQPDIIVITGDLIDSRKTKVAVALKCIKQMAEVAPVYYVSGNHEYNSGQYATLKEELVAVGATVLDNSGFILERDGEQIALIGLADTAFFEYGNDYMAENKDIFAQELADLATEYHGMFTILLSHRPEKMSVYVAQDIDLVFAGHAHGGQFRLPLLGGLVAPDQGLFPKYTSGLYELDGTGMVVSRGLGNSIVPLRIFNRPELVVVKLSGN